MTNRRTLPSDPPGAREIGFYVEEVVGTCRVTTDTKTSFVQVDGVGWVQLA